MEILNKVGIFLFTVIKKLIIKQQNENKVKDILMKTTQTSSAKVEEHVIGRVR